MPYGKGTYGNTRGRPPKKQKNNYNAPKSSIKRVKKSQKT